MDIWIDNRYFKVNQNYTIFQYCAKIGINLPCFCYHERLSIAGNCRICLVEANSAMVVSCATLLVDKMQIYTKSKRIKKARESVLEFLLVNHPLDCPICDQGGECDLQDILMIYGADRGRFYELNKRSVTNLNCLGPFVKTVMTRCIHCTRCVRFVNEVSSVFDFGIIGRGSGMEIGTYIQNFINDELIANIIDLCPVGALVAMPASFSGRSWELKYIQSIDILDSMGTTIRIAVAANNVYRILPCLDEYYDEWITNKARFIFDSFNIQRLYYPKLKLYFKFIILSWKSILLLYLYFLYKKAKSYISIFFGNYLSIESGLTLKLFFNNIGCSNFIYNDYENNNYFELDNRCFYLLNQTIKNICFLNNILFIGCNPRLEAPLLNTNYRKAYNNNNNIKIYSIGLALNYATYPIINLGSSIKYLNKFFLGSTLVTKYFLFDNYYNLSYFNIKNMININVFLGNSILVRFDFMNVFNSLIYVMSKLHLNWKNLNVIQRNLGRITGSELNLLSKINVIQKNKFNSFNHLLGIDKMITGLTLKNNFNVYQGSFYLSNIFNSINIILPVSIYTESNESYINLEGRFRQTNKVITPFKFIFSDLDIIKSFSILLKFIYKENFSIIEKFYYIFDYLKNIINYFKINLNNYKQEILFYELNKFIREQINSIYSLNIYNSKISNSLITKTIFNYYNSDVFSKKSKVMIIASNKLKLINFNN